MKRILFTVGLSLLLAIGCQNNPKKEKETPKTVEVKVEKTDSLTKATVITKRTENGFIEVETFNEKELTEALNKAIDKQLNSDAI